MSHDATHVLNRPSVLTWGVLVPAATFAVFAFAVLRWHWSMGGYVGRQQADILTPLIPVGAAVVALANAWTLLRSWTKVGLLFLAGLLVPTLAIVILNAYVVNAINRAPLVVDAPREQGLAMSSRCFREAQRAGELVLVGRQFTSTLDVGAPANNRLKLPARGRPVADARSRTRAAA